jgi:hypothetical protein
MDKDLNRGDWLKAARMALLKGGVEAVRVEKLARNLSMANCYFTNMHRQNSELSVIKTSCTRKMNDLEAVLLRAFR